MRLSDEKRRAVADIARALLRAETDEDVALVADVLRDVKGISAMSDVEARMAASAERLSRIRRT